MQAVPNHLASFCFSTAASVIFFQDSGGRPHLQLGVCTLKSHHVTQEADNLTTKFEIKRPGGRDESDNPAGYSACPLSPHENPCLWRSHYALKHFDWLTANASVRPGRHRRRPAGSRACLIGRADCSGEKYLNRRRTDASAVSPQS